MATKKSNGNERPSKDPPSPSQLAWGDALLRVMIVRKQRRYTVAGICRLHRADRKRFWYDKTHGKDIQIMNYAYDNLGYGPIPKIEIVNATLHALENVPRPILHSHWTLARFAHHWWGPVEHGNSPWALFWWLKRYYPDGITISEFVAAINTDEDSVMLAWSILEHPSAEVMATTEKQAQEIFRHLETMTFEEGWCLVGYGKPKRWRFTQRNVVPIHPVGSPEYKEARERNEKRRAADLRLALAIAKGKRIARKWGK